MSQTEDDMHGKYVKNFKINYPLVHIILMNANYPVFYLSISNSNFCTVAIFESFKYAVLLTEPVVMLNFCFYTISHTPSFSNAFFTPVTLHVLVRCFRSTI